MKKSINYFLLLTLVILSFIDLNGQISISTSNNFQDNTTQGWNMGASAPAGAVTNVLDLGPDGVGDNALQITTTGSGPGGKMVIENSNSEWVGNWTNVGSLYFNFSINNVSGANLNIRVAMQDASNNRICTTNAITVPSNSGWHGYSVPVGIANFVLLGGSTISSILGAVTKIRIINNPTPSWVGINATNTVLLDNISVSFDPLPVELSSFTVIQLDNKVIIDWVTESEQNVDYYEVQHSTDGIKFEAFVDQKSHNSISKKVYTAQTSKYSKGINYYRLKVIDLDGKYSWSSIISLFIDTGFENIVLKPNPTNDFLQIELFNKNAIISKLSIFDITGQLQVLDNTIENGSIKVDVKKLKKGIYLLNMIVDNVLEVKKFVVN
jgi:hypothetical protein